MQNKKAKNKRNSRQKGFSLIEVLIAIAILAAITIPLAMNMISTSQINSKSKSTSTAADLSASVLESMQSVNLSDLLVEMNGYETNEYGEKLAYSIAKNSLHGFTVGDKFEARVSADGKKSYVPVTKQADGMADSLVTSSIKVRKTNDDVVKTYFTGHKGEDGKIDNSYSVVMQDVHNDEDSFDIVMDIEEGQSYEIANINAMDQSNIVNMFESGADATDVMNKIMSDNKMAHSVSSEIPIIGDVDGDGDVTVMDATKLQRYLTDGHEFTELEKKAFDVNLDGDVDALDATVLQRYIGEFKTNFGKLYQKEYIINIQQDKNTEATNIIVECKYHIVYPELLGQNQKVITKKIGAFSTNSTFEFAKGIYLYYNPNNKDKFTINNRNELATTVYLIASTSDGNVSSTYHPSITLNELSSQVYVDSARTTICSNIPNEQWKTKTVIPAKNNELEIKTLANVGNQQTLYNVSVKVYKHNKASFNADNVFEPNEKNLLIQTDGSFLDNSVMHDIDSNKTTGLNIAENLASVVPGRVVYNGDFQSEYTATNVTLSGETEAVDAGRYTIFATPNTGYSWADGTTGQKSFEWEIECLKAAKYETPSGLSFVYDGQTHSPVVGEHVIISGQTEMNKVGVYRITVQPEKNYAWEDAVVGKETEIRYVDWEITPKPVTVEWGTTSWTYDGLTHIAKCKVKASDLIAGDSCSVILDNYMIKEVGSQTAIISSLSNKNYVLANDAEKSKLLTVLEVGKVKAEITEGLVYNGKTQTGITFTPSDGVTIKSGRVSAQDAGTYKVVVGLKKGYKWTDGSSETKTFTWSITPAEVKVKWGAPSWYTKSNGWDIVESDENGNITQCNFKDNEIDEIKWIYNGETHQINKLYFVGSDGKTIESLTFESANLENNSITNAGSTTVHLNNFKDNNNYKCEATVKISVAPGTAYFEVHKNNDNKNFEYTGSPQKLDLDYSNVQIVPIKVSDGESYPMTWNGGAPYDYDPDENYTIDDLINQTNAGTYVIHLKPMENHVWKDATPGHETETRELSWTIAPVKDAWITGLNYNEATGDYEIETILYSYADGDPVKCAYGENIKLSFTAVENAIKTETISAASRLEDEIAEVIETTWVEVTEPSKSYFVKAKPVLNHAWADGSTDEKTIPFIVGDPEYTPRFNMTPLFWMISHYRYYNGDIITPYFASHTASYTLGEIGRKENNKIIIGGEYENENTRIEVTGDAEKMKAGQYTLFYENTKGSKTSGSYDWEIKKRPIKVELLSGIETSASNINSVDDIKRLIIENMYYEADEKLINEAISFGFAIERDGAIESLYDENNQPLYQIMGNNDTVTDIVMTVYKDGSKVQNVLNSGQYEFEIKSIKITHNDGTDVSDCYEVDLNDAKGTFTLQSEGQATLNDGIGVAVDLFSQDCVLVGDVDGDGEVTVDDATDIQRYLVGSETFNKKQRLAADVERDGGVNEIDVTRLLQYLDEVQIPSYCRINTYVFLSDCILVGDVDGDYKITSTDATLIQKYAIGIIKDFTNRQKIAGDADGDGRVSISDTTVVQKYISDDYTVTTSYPVGKYVSLLDYCFVGDVNGDGDINNRDSVILNGYITGSEEYKDDITNMNAADVNGDGEVNNRDAMMLERYVNGNHNLGSDCKIGRIISAHVE